MNTTSFDRLREASRAQGPTVEVLRDDIVSALNQADSWNDTRIEQQIEMAEYNMPRLLERLRRAEEVIKELRRQSAVSFKTTALVYALEAHRSAVAEWRKEDGELYGS